MIKQAQSISKNAIPPSITNMAPALVETYSRLLVYTEIESLGIKGFLSKFLFFFIIYLITVSILRK